MLIANDEMGLVAKPLMMRAKIKVPLATKISKSISTRFVYLYNTYQDSLVLHYNQEMYFFNIDSLLDRNSTTGAVRFEVTL